MLILVLLLTFFHLSQTLLFAFKIGNWKSKNNHSQPSFSIIIAARNELENLQKHIPRLLSQDYPYYEIIIALDRCNDSSAEHLQSIKDQRLRYVEIEETPDNWNAKKFALHTAIEQSQGEWILFSDADCYPNSNDWLSSVAKEITDKIRIVIGISPYIEKNTFLSKYIQFEAFMTYFLYAGFTLIGKSYMAVGRNFAIQKSYFLTNNGYMDIKKINGGDDDLIIQKLSNSSNTSMFFGKDSLVNTLPKNSWKAYWRQKLRHFSVSKSYSTKNKVSLTFYHLFHLLFYISLFLTISSHYFLPIILFTLFIKLVSYRFAAKKIGAGFNYILLPFVDILYAILSPVLGIGSKLVKDIKWKN